MVVTKQTIIGDVLDYNPETAQFFFEIGMHCLGCPHSRGEAIEDACRVHGTDADTLVKKLNDFLRFGWVLSVDPLAVYHIALYRSVKLVS